jgi:hypothetical protein
MFFNAWALTDHDAQRAEIRAAFADNGTYDDPRTPETLTGPDAIAAYVRNFAENAPGWSARVVKSDTVGGLHRVTVAFGGPGPDGSEMQQLGQYILALSEAGQIERATGFAGTGDPE